MSKPNDGGQAFPYSSGTPGMSLRDYFAAKAMQARMKNLGDHGHQTKEEVDECRASTARMSYEIADAMLKAREV